MKTRILTLLALGSVCCGSAVAQQVYPLDTLFTLADQRSRSIKVSEAALSVATDELKAAKADRLPDIGAQLSVSYNGRGLITDRDFTNPMNIYIPEFGNSFALKVSEVIYSGGAITSGIALGELGQRMAELTVEKNRQEVRFVITGQYLDLYKSYNSLQVVRRNISLTENMLRQMRSRYEQGMALRSDITRYELQSEALKLQATRLEDGIKILNHRLCVAVGLDADTQIMPDTTMLAKAALPPSSESSFFSVSSVLSEAHWQQQALSQNLTLRQAQLSQQMGDKRIALERSALLPHVSLFAENYLNGPITIEIPAINKNFNYWFVGVGVQYQLSSLFKQSHKVRAARQSRRQADEQLALAREQVETAVHAAHTDLLTSQADLHTQEKSTQLAQENYQVVSNRYQNGLALITDLLDASNVKLQAELQLVNAHITQLYQLYRLRYLSHSL